MFTQITGLFRAGSAIIRVGQAAFSTSRGVVTVARGVQATTATASAAGVGTAGFLGKKVYDESSPERIAAKQVRMDEATEKTVSKAEAKIKQVRTSNARHQERLDKRSDKQNEARAEKKQKAFNRDLKKVAAVIAKVGEKNGIGNVLSTLVGMATGQAQDASKEPKTPEGPGLKETILGFAKDLGSAIRS